MATALRQRYSRRGLPSQSGHVGNRGGVLQGCLTGAYSGFEGVDENGTPLLNWLRQRGVDEVDVVGIATDHCVRQTAEDAVRNGLATRVLVDLTAGVSADTTVAALEEMRTASVELVCSS